jgi:hypothetical protein
MPSLIDTEAGLSRLTGRRTASDGMAWLLDGEDIGLLSYPRFRLNEHDVCCPLDVRRGGGTAGAPPMRLHVEEARGALSRSRF